jgi:competence protein ComEA
MTSSFPFTRRQALAGAAALAVLLVLAGRLLVQPGPDAEAPPAAVIVAETTEPEQPSQVVVHVVGAVRSPGLYRLDEGSRVADAVSLAGGAMPKANLGAVNLALPLVDGTQIVVPRAGEASASPAPPGVAGGAAAGVASGPIQLNTATTEQLQTIPGIGPVTAERIIQYREENGPFRSVDDLDAVSGIGPKRLEQLRDLVTP